MGVVAIEGFDLYNGTGSPLGLQSGWTAVNWFYGPGLQTGRFGGQCLFYSNEGCESGWQMPAAVGPDFTVANAYRHSNLAAINQAATVARSVICLSSGGFGNRQLGWRPNADGSISVFRMTSSTAGTWLGQTPAGVLLNNVWHWIDFSGTLNTATGAVTLKVDGVTQLTLTNVNTCGVAASTTFDGIVWGSNGGLSNGSNVSCDDLYVLDTSVTLGERRIETIRPNADTTTIQWTPDSGTVHYSRVNATLAQSSTYVKANVVGNLDLYETLDLSSTPANIDYVKISAWMQKNDAGARNVGLVADIAGTQLQSPDKVLTASLVRYFYGMSAKPGGGTWDSGSVNGLRVGPKVTA